MQCCFEGKRERERERQRERQRDRQRQTETERQRETERERETLLFSWRTEGGSDRGREGEDARGRGVG